MGRIVFRIALAGFVLFGGLVYAGWRHLRASWGAPSEPTIVNLQDMNPGEGVESIYLDLEGYHPLVEKAAESESSIYVPLAPLPEDGVPTRPGTLKALADQTRYLAALPRDTSLTHIDQLLAEGTGVVRGPAEEICPDNTKRDLEEELGFAIDGIPVVGMGQTPATMLGGLAMMIGGVVGFLATGYVTMKPYFAD